jgi:hypothetical protein
LERSGRRRGMDRYETEQERKERWYAAHLTPRPIKVLPARTWEDLAGRGADDDGTCASSTLSAGETNTRTSPYDGDHVWSLPYEWLSRDPSGTDGERVQRLMRNSMEEHGFVVISGVLRIGECAVALERAWDWLEAASFAERETNESSSSSSSSTSTSCGNRRSGSEVAADSDKRGVVDPSRRRSLLQNFPKSVEGGIQPFYGSGHSTLAWFVRGHPHVRQVFASLHNCSSRDLLASLDGIILWPDPLHCESGDGEGMKISDAGWFHVDQNPRHRPGREGVQGLVNLLPVSRATGGNTLVAHSHVLFPDHYTARDAHDASTFYEQRLDEVGSDDWLEIDPTDAVLLDPSAILMLELGQGDVLLWDSRTVHCSYPPDPEVAAERTVPSTSGLLRAATLVNMVPAGSVASRATRFARHEASAHMRTLTHGVNKAAPLGNERTDQVALEERRVAAVLEWQARCGTKVLLSWDDLSTDQRTLVVGSDTL